MAREPTDLPDYEFYRPMMKCGDVVAFGGKGAFSRVIKWRWNSPYSHVGLVYRTQIEAGGDSVFLVESTTLSNIPDAVTGDRRKGVQLHWLSKRLTSYDGEAWWVPLLEPLELGPRSEMVAWLRQTHDARVPYDTDQAMGAGLDFWDSWGLENDPDYSRLFCSELVTRALQIAGRVESRVNPSETSPAEVVAFGCMGRGVRIR